MNRRDALAATALLTGGALLGPGLWLSSCGSDAGVPEGVLEAEPYRLLEAIADALLPDTEASPGAKAAGAGPFMQLLLTDCYAEADQQRAVAALAEFRRACLARHGRAFEMLEPAQREELLLWADAEARRGTGMQDFPLLRELAERSYFSSEAGMTQALRWIPVPGRWQGCVPLEPGQPAWG